jgi:arsenate reductase (thioredoxin)
MAEAPKATHPKAVNALPPQRVLFLCVGNSARSQMAEGFARKFAPPDVEIWSAGIEPKTLNPAAIEVMKEIGIDIADQRPKHVNEVPWQSADTVITLCGEAQELCPAVPVEVRRMHWPLADPAKAKPADRLAAFREARDEVRWRVASLWPAR